MVHAPGEERARPAPVDGSFRQHSFGQRSLASINSLQRSLSGINAVHPSLLSVDVDADGGAHVGGADAPTDGAPHAAPSATAPQAACNLAISIAGFACASLPYAVATMSWPGMAAVLLSGGATALLSCHLVATLVESPTGTRHSTYAALTAAHLWSDTKLGKAASETIRTLQAVACVGTCITSTIIGGQALKQLLSLTAGRPLLPLGAWTAVFGAVLAAAAALPSMEHSWVLSLSGMVSFVVYSLVMVGASIADGRSSGSRSYEPLSGSARPLPSDFGSAVYGIGIIVFAFGVGVSPEVAATLAKPVERRMHVATALTFSVILPLYTAIACAGYYGYGDTVKSVLIQSNADATDSAARRGVVSFALVAVCVNSVAIYTVYSWPIYTAVGTLFKAATKKARCCAPVSGFRSRVGDRVAACAGRFLFVALTTLAAAALPFFADVASALGGVFLLQDYLFPPIFAAVSRERPRPRAAVRAVAFAIAAASAALGALIVGAAVCALVRNAQTYRLFADL